MTSKIFSIAANRRFVDALAGQLLQEAEGDPLKFADALIFLPTRRACQALGEAFLRHNQGRALILPRLRPIGEIDDAVLSFLPESGTGERTGMDAAFSDDLPPAIGETQALLALTPLVQAKSPGIGAARALSLAESLLHWMNEVDTEGLSFERLDRLAPDRFAKHWEITLQFLSILREAWPAYLQEEGLIGSARRNRLSILAQIQAWRDQPPTSMVIAAGSTGSVPASAALMKQILQLPAGRIVLPGLDRYMPRACFDQAKDDPTHPQYGLARLLSVLDIPRQEVKEWPRTVHEPAGSSEERLIFLSEALLPAESLSGSGSSDLRRNPRAVAGIENMRLIEATSPRQEAAAIAFILRQCLEKKGKTAALVTHDRALARRTRLALARYGITIDDSAGQPASLIPAGVFMRLAAVLVAEDFAPVPLLAFLKHPFCRLGMKRSQLLQQVRAFEDSVLRSDKFSLLPVLSQSGQVSGLDRLRESLKQSELSEKQTFLNLLERLADSLSPLLEAAAHRTTGQWLDAQIAACEQAATEGPENIEPDDLAEESALPSLWAGEDGHALARELTAVLDQAQRFSGPQANIRRQEWPDILTMLLRRIAIRPRYGGHPRLRILSPLEARLQSCDLIVLGGLNEGSFPPDPGGDPWMSRPMRADFGLPPLERRIGLSAHDFVEGAAARETVLTRTILERGAPTVPARWLQKLTLAAKRIGHPLIPDQSLIDLVNALDAPPPETAQSLAQSLAQNLAGPSSRPCPVPPLSVRPRRLSVTAIQEGMNNPYALYARRILRLSPLGPLDTAQTAAQRGTLIHAIMESAMKSDLPADLSTLRQKILDVGIDHFAACKRDQPALYQFWWPRFVQALKTVMEDFTARPLPETIHVEVQGETAFNLPGGKFTLRAIADRIDVYSDGTLRILDYKTGQPPSIKQIKTLRAPQLMLEALIATRGGFEMVDSQEPVAVSILPMSGRPEERVSIPTLEDKEDKAEFSTVLKDIEARLIEWVGYYDRPETGYLANPPQSTSYKEDFTHLIRHAEWGQISEDSFDREGEET